MFPSRRTAKPANDAVQRQRTDYLLTSFSVPCCFSNFNHHAQMSLRLLSCANPRPNHPRAFSIFRLDQKILATVRSPTNYPPPCGGRLPNASSWPVEVRTRRTVSTGDRTLDILADLTNTCSVVARRTRWRSVAPPDLSTPTASAHRCSEAGFTTPARSGNARALILFPSNSSSLLAKVHNVTSLGHCFRPAAYTARAAG